MEQIKNIIATKNAPAAIGPYSQAVCVGGLVFLSGQLAIDPATGTWWRAAFRLRPNSP